MDSRSFRFILVLDCSLSMIFVSARVKNSLAAAIVARTTGSACSSPQFGSPAFLVEKWLRLPPKVSCPVYLLMRYNGLNFSLMSFRERGFPLLHIFPRVCTPFSHMAFSRFHFDRCDRHPDLGGVRISTIIESVSGNSLSPPFHFPLTANVGPAPGNALVMAMRRRLSDLLFDVSPLI